MVDLTDLQKDILVKAAEGIQEGLWCRGVKFLGFTPEQALLGEMYGTSLTLDMVRPVQRCALGELEFRTAELGGKFSDFSAVRYVVSEAVNEACDMPHGAAIVDHNDKCLYDADIFTAGQEWAEIFRKAAGA